MSQHTPGPWALDGFNLSTVIHCTAERGSPEAKHTCGDYKTIARCEGDNWQANARLIAAAPEMLEALDIVVGCLLWNKQDEASIEVMRRVNAVRAKAGGRS